MDLRRASTIRRPAPGRVLHRRPACGWRCCSRRPLLWLVVAYLGSLAVLFVSAFWTTNDFTGNVVRHVHHEQLPTALSRQRLPHRHAAQHRRRRLGHGLDAVIAFPMALLHGQGRLAAGAAAGWSIAILTPLWASYLVKAYAWRVMLASGGLIDWVLNPFGTHGPGTAFRPPC